MSERRPAAFVFSTGVGASALFDEARALGRAAELLEAVRRGGATAGARRPWPRCTGRASAASLKARLAVHDGGVGSRCWHAVELDTGGSGAGALRGAERGAGARRSLSRGPVLAELLVYGWELPEDTAPFAGAVEALVEGELAAAAFTTQIQARHLMAVAERIGRREALVEALRSRVVVAAVGPTCARVLEELGIPAHVVPAARRWARCWTRWSHDWRCGAPHEPVPRVPQAVRSRRCCSSVEGGSPPASSRACSAPAPGSRSSPRASPRSCGSPASGSSAGASRRATWTAAGSWSRRPRRTVNREVAEAAHDRRIFVNAVDDLASASAYLGGVVRRGAATVAISTGGRAPALAGLLREALERLLPEDLGDWVTSAEQLRGTVAERGRADGGAATAAAAGAGRDSTAPGSRHDQPGTGLAGGRRARGSRSS